MQIVGKVPNDRSCRSVARRIRPVVVAIIFGLAAAASAVLPALTGGASATAFACGIGNTPTMAANRTPALLLPVTHTISADQPIGILAPQYVVGQPITFSEDLSNVLSPPPQAGLQYLWTFGDGTQAVGLTATHVFTKPGNYAVHTWYPAVAPSSGQESFDSAEIHVIAAAFSNPPVAKATASTLSIGPDGTITFSAAGSHSEDGTKLTYLWNFNDGVTNTAPVISHKFPDIPGNWIVGLTVTDAHGASSFTELHIRIFDFPQLPSASITSSLTTIGTGNTVTFDASGSTPPTAPGTPTGDQIVKYVWSFGDGTQAVTTTTPTITHRFSRAGAFTVTVEAIDSVGAPGSKSVTITVVPGPDQCRLAALAAVWWRSTARHSGCCRLYGVYQSAPAAGFGGGAPGGRRAGAAAAAARRGPTVAAGVSLLDTAQRFEPVTARRGALSPAVSLPRSLRRVAAKDMDQSACAGHSRHSRA